MWGFRIDIFLNHHEEGERGGLPGHHVMDPPPHADTRTLTDLYVSLV